MPLIQDKGKKLRDAASYGDLGLVRKLCEEMAANVNAANRYGDSPLHKACRRGYLDMVRYFVKDRKANVHAKDEEGDQPLHSACITGHVQIVRFLVQEGGADPQAKNKEDWTPLHKACYWARKHKNVAVVEFLKKHINGGLAEEESNATQIEDKQPVIKKEKTEKQGEHQRQKVSSEQPNQQQQEVLDKSVVSGDIERLRKVVYQADAPVHVTLEYIKVLRENAKIVGKGAFGSVSKVQDKQRGWIFALKQIMYPIQTSDEQKFIENSFRTELAMQMQHNTCCSLSTRSVAHSIRSEKRKELTSMLRLHVLFQVMRALHYLHQGGPKGSTPFLHRDVKSANICLTDSYTAKLIDCGLGKLVDDDNQSIKSAMSSGSLVFGTNGYTCPWYSKGGSRRYEPACDVYSFGIVMMECITGRLQGGQSSQDETSLGDFRSRYIEDDEEEEVEDGLVMLLNDSDPGAGWEQEILGHLAELALNCASQKKKNRPGTEDCMDKLSRFIHQE